MSGWCWIRARRWQPYDAVRVVLGLLLLIAAVLKGHQLATEPIFGRGILNSRWLLMATVEFELLLGLCLLANLWPKPTWAVVLGCFALFTCVSLYKALSGDATCGCFGRVPLKPGYTATLDLSAVLSLLIWRPKGREWAFASHFERLRRRAVAVLAVWLFLGLPAGIAMGSYADTTLSEAGHVMGNGNIVVLKPDSWIGKRFPLLEYIDNGERLTRGSWAVLFYHRDCPVCQEAIPRYEACARRSRPEQGDTRIALIEVPPYDRPLSHTPTKGSSCLLGRLDSDHKWFVETPLEVTVDGGVVIRVTKG